ncbi:MAG: hypothetical protein IT324_14130 [Anaerolineae bacterium]|nr:hypothetical protein [Anaerolineae bacterium]
MGIAMSPQLAQAVYNNAVWCDTVCRAHGSPGTFTDHLWFNPNPTPPYYPNAQTLSGEAGVTEQLRVVQHLIDSRKLVGFAVKDSFNRLDLTPLGFRSLFEATWLWRSLTQPKPSIDTKGIRWSVIQQPDNLAQWEAARADQPMARIFLPSLLADQDVVFIAVYRDQQLIGGGIGNRTGNIVGLSNVFTPTGESSDILAGCVAAIMTAFPGLPIVGYEHSESLAIAQALGFEALGSLRVWGYPAG